MIVKAQAGDQRPCAIKVRRGILNNPVIDACASSTGRWPVKNTEEEFLFRDSASAFIASRAGARFPMT